MLAISISHSPLNCAPEGMSEADHAVTPQDKGQARTRVRVVVRAMARAMGSG